MVVFSKIRRFLGKSDAFTLMELLVVMTIIVTLAALLLPSLQQARDKAKEVVCVSNLRQIGMAILMYAQDWKGKAPPGVSQSGYRQGSNASTYIYYDPAGGGGTPPSTWSYFNSPQGLNLGTLCWDYIPRGSAKALFCPHRMQLFYGGDYTKRFSSYFDGYAQTYLNDFYSAFDAGASHIGYVYRAANDIGTPSYRFAHQNYDVYRDRKKCIVADVYYRGRQVQAHGGRLNLLFLDGHVKSTDVVVPTTMSYGYDVNTTTTFETYFDPEY